MISLNLSPLGNRVRKIELECPFRGMFGARRSKDVRRYIDPDPFFSSSLNYNACVTEYREALV